MKYEIVVCIDRSGSMQQGKDDYIGGLKSFINDQKHLDANFTLVQFDTVDAFELVFDGVDIKSVDVDKVELVPRGGTPLLDCVGRTLAHLESRIKDQADVQPIVMIITDGQENSSREWSREKVRKSIEEKKTWKIMFLGADMDAFAEAGGMGIGVGSTMSNKKTARGISNSYQACSGSIFRMAEVYTAGGIVTDALCASNYTEDERTACMAEDGEN